MATRNLEADDIIEGKYRIIRLIGRGGMGAVYEGKHTGTGRRVAIKVIHPQGPGGGDVLVQRFQREAKAAGAIESQYIAQIFDTGVDSNSDSPFLVMEFLTGEDAQQIYRRLGTLSVDLALRIIAQSCIGLARAHEAKVVHRDIKPANIFLSDREDGEIICKILDFGVAKFTVDQDMATEQMTEGGGLTQTGALLGSPLYMSPEQARGRRDIDLRADIWSLGVTLYKLLTGRTPPEKNGTPSGVGEVIMSICMTPPSSVRDMAPWVPPEVDAILMRALQLDPKDRYQSANEFLDDIRPLLPNGLSITKSMLVRANHQAEISRNSLIPPVSLRAQPFGDLVKAGPDAGSGNKPVSTDGGSNADSAADKPSATAAGVSATAPAAAPASKAPKWAVVALGLGALGAVGAYQFTRPAVQPPAPTPAATAVVPEKQPAPSALAAPNPPAPLPAATAEPPATTTVAEPALSASAAPAPLDSVAGKYPPTATGSKTAKPAGSTAKAGSTDRVIDSSAFGDRK